MTFFKREADSYMRRLLGAPAAPLGTPRPDTAPCGTPEPEDPGEPPTGTESSFAPADHEHAKPTQRTLRADQLCIADLACLARTEQDGLAARGILLHFEPVDAALNYAFGGQEVDALVRGVLVRLVGLGNGQEIELTLDPDTTVHLTRLVK